jgi:hypothetical protein
MPSIPRLDPSHRVQNAHCEPALKNLSRPQQRLDTLSSKEMPSGSPFKSVLTAFGTVFFPFSAANLRRRKMNLKLL